MRIKLHAFQDAVIVRSIVHEETGETVYEVKARSADGKPVTMHLSAAYIERLKK